METGENGSQATIAGRPQVPEITEAQRKTLKELRDFIASRKYPPTMSELGERLGVAAASAHQLVKQLERKGYVSREARKARSLSVVRDPEDRPEKLVPVPLVGTVAAGPALLAEENHLGDVLIDQSIAGRGRCFALRINGESMTGAGMRLTNTKEARSVRKPPDDLHRHRTDVPLHPGAGG